MPWNAANAIRSVLVTDVRSARESKALGSPSASRDLFPHLPREDLEDAFLTALGNDARLPAPWLLGHLADETLQQMTSRLTHLKQECGCKAGAWCLLLGLVVPVVLAMLLGSFVGIVGLATLCIISAITFSFTGKVVAIVVSRVRWHQERDRLLRELRNSEFP
jgi:hypothetical protein